MNAGVVACSLVEAQQRLGLAASGEFEAAPAIARQLRDAGAGALCLLDVGTVEGRSLSWLATEHASGWLALDAGAQPPAHGVFTRELEAAMARGFVAADAAVLALMASTGSRQLPLLSWSEAPVFVSSPPTQRRRLDLYAIVDSAQRVQGVLEAGLRTVQLRIKTPEQPPAGWHQTLRHEVQRSVSLCAAADAELFINDHWQLAAELGARGVHLGQEDLLALGDSGRAALQATGMALGISSHSLWELCRARALAPRYIACGPVWPTLTKAMPWRAQGLDNLAWWRRWAGFPVVAIGGILGAQQVREAAACEPDGICIVRGLGERPAAVVPALQAAMEAGRADAASSPIEPPAWPHPSLAAR